MKVSGAGFNCTKLSSEIEFHCMEDWEKKLRGQNWFYKDEKHNKIYNMHLENR